MQVYVALMSFFLVIKLRMAKEKENLYFKLAYLFITFILTSQLTVVDYSV